MNKEEWRPVPSCPGIMASSRGRFILPPRTMRMPNGGFKTYTPKPRYGSLAKTRSGRKARMIFNSREFGTIKVHRIVCEAFHGPAPEGLENVLHSDENPTNNRPENLSWGTQKENLNAPGFLEHCKSRTGENSPYTKGRKSK